jgi:ABC-2 type transport system ATP-binding protein
MQARQDPDVDSRSVDVELRGVSKSFRTPRGQVSAVCGIDVSIPAGETVALLGPNGAGKSTTIDMLLGLSRPDSGSVSLLGRAPSDAVEAGLVGAMLQAGALIRDVSARELLRMMASLYPDSLEVGEALELVDRAGHQRSGLAARPRQRHVVSARARVPA